MIFNSLFYDNMLSRRLTHTNANQVFFVGFFVGFKPKHVKLKEGTN